MGGVANERVALHSVRSTCDVAHVALKENKAGQVQPLHGLRVPQVSLGRRFARTIVSCI